MNTAVIPIPESGQLVTVRGRRWIVGEVSASSMTLDLMRQATAAGVLAEWPEPIPGYHGH